MNYIPNFSAWTPIFAVPHAITDTHIKLLSGVALKAMLLILRHNGTISTEEIANLLSQSVGDINDALSELARFGLLVPLGAEALPYAKQMATPTISPPIAENPAPPPPQLPQEDSKPTRIALSKPSLTRSEAHELIASDKNLEHLIHEAQSIKGDTFSSAEMSTLVSLYSYYGLASDFILMGMQYCRSINKFSMGYIEKTISSWVNMGIDDYEKAECHIVRLAEYRKRETQIRNAFGIGDRALGDKEREFIKLWYDTLGYDISMIKFAFERTIENTGKLSFAYINKILTTWHEKGYKTSKEASLEQKKTDTNADTFNQNSPKHAPSRKASYDISELQNLIYSGYKEGEK